VTICSLQLARRKRLATSVHRPQVKPDQTSGLSAGERRGPKIDMMRKRFGPHSFAITSDRSASPGANPGEQAKTTPRRRGTSGKKKSTGLIKNAGRGICPAQCCDAKLPSPPDSSDRGRWTDALKHKGQARKTILSTRRFPAAHWDHRERTPPRGPFTSSSNEGPLNVTGEDDFTGQRAEKWPVLSPSTARKSEWGCKEALPGHRPRL